MLTGVQLEFDYAPHRVVRTDAPQFFTRKFLEHNPIPGMPLLTPAIAYEEIAIAVGAIEYDLEGLDG